MYRQIMISFGELYTKGRNRKKFISQLEQNILHALSDFSIEVKVTHDHLYIVNYAPQDEMLIIHILADISGIYYINVIEIYEKDLAIFLEAGLSIMKRKSGKTFKIITKRNDKTFPILSDDINREIAHHILVNTSWTVDVNDPDVKLEIKIYHDGAYFVVEKYPGVGGYPLGIIGQGLLMLSGGIDSPVAGYLTLRRGIKITCIHFASPPYTQEGVILKLKSLLHTLNRYQRKIDLYIVPFTKLQETLYQTVRPSYTVTIMRRMMYRLSEKLAHDLKLSVIINGESIAQVASQTLESLKAINAVTTYPIIRPLATMDKSDIVTIARRINTFETSILPYEDCCTIFSNDNPETKPRAHLATTEEEKFPYQVLLDEAYANIQHIVVE